MLIYHHNYALLILVDDIAGDDVWEPEHRKLFQQC